MATLVVRERKPRNKPLLTLSLKQAQQQPGYFTHTLHPKVLNPVKLSFFMELLK